MIIMLTELLIALTLYSPAVPNYHIEMHQEYAITSTRKKKTYDIDLESLNPYMI